MTDKKHPGTRGDGWSLWASQEAEIARGRRNLIFALLGGVLAVVLCSFYIMHLHGRVDYLAGNRTMFCKAEGGGIYSSTDEHPEEMVMQYARRYVQNYKQFDWDGVETSFDRAMKMMAPEVAAANRGLLDEEARKAKRQYLSQYFTRGAETLEETDDGYRYTVKGRIAGFAGSTPLRPRDTTVSVRLRKITPNEARPEGLVVTSSSG